MEQRLADLHQVIHDLIAKHGSGLTFTRSPVGEINVFDPSVIEKDCFGHGPGPRWLGWITLGSGKPEFEEA